MEIPEDWTLFDLQSIAPVIDCKHRTPSYVETGVPIISPGDIKWDGLDFERARRVSRTDANSLMDHCKIEKGDLIIGRNQKVGIAALVDEQTDFVIGQDTVLVKSSEASPEFLQSLFASDIIAKQIYRLLGGSTFGRVNLKDFRKLKIPLPPLTQRTHIAEILGTWDRAIAATETLVAQGEAQKKALMQQLLTGKRRLPGFNGAWREVRLGDVADLTSGNAFKSSDILEEGRFRLIRMNDLKAGVLKNDEPRFVADYAAEGLTRFILHPGDFVFGMTGSLSNYAWISPNLSNVLYLNQRVGKLNAKKNNSNRFLQHLYLSTPLQDNIVRMAAGAAQLNISLRDLRSFKISVPSFAEQQAIATIIDMAADETHLFKAKLQTLKTEKSALMQQLLTGKRRVKLTEVAA